MRLGSTPLRGCIATALLLIATYVEAAPVSLGRVTATAGILINRATGQIVWERNPDLPLPPASTTKVLTSLIALESARVNDTVRVSRTAATAAPSKIYLQPGWGMRVDDLVYALMLKSANDAAEVVAEGLSGSVDGFAVRMTQKARALGARNSVFRNPHGLPDEGHLSTARDLTIIFQAAMRNSRFRQIALTKATVIQPVSGSKRRISLRSHNRLLDGYQVPVIGKTGYTRAAKRCFVGAALGGDGNEYLVAILGSRDLWGDVTRMLDYAYAGERAPDLGDDVQMVEADSDMDLVPARLKLPRPGKRAVAANARRGADRAGAQVAKVTVRRTTGETETLSIGDADEDVRVTRSSPRASGKKSPYVVQLATLNSSARAEQLRAAAQRKGYACSVQAIGKGKGRQYRVRVEGFNNRKAAERAAARLKGTGDKVRPIILAGD